jgi:hypothetical protein
MSKGIEQTDAIRRMREAIQMLPPGAVRERYQARYDLVVQRIAEFPHRVAAQLHRASREECALVMRIETQRILDAWEQTE